MDDLDIATRASKRASWCQHTLQATVHDLQAAGDPRLGALVEPAQAAAQQVGELVERLGASEWQIIPR